MAKMCKNCTGSGKLLGGGFVQVKCDNCKGTGKYDPIKNKANDASSADSDVSTNHKIDKRSKAYKEAIKELTDSGLSKAEAEKIFSEEMDKLDAKS